MDKLLFLLNHPTGGMVQAHSSGIIATDSASTQSAPWATPTHSLWLPSPTHTLLSLADKRGKCKMLFPPHSPCETGFSSEKNVDLSSIQLEASNLKYDRI